MIFIKNMNDYDEINEIYSQYFKSKPPAREAIQVSALPKNVNVEISASRMRLKAKGFFGFILRTANRGLVSQKSGDTLSDKALENSMKLVGSAPLKDLVSDTSDVVERICIKTALELTGNNRVAAAEMLSLSRQSLYIKLRKYGLLKK